MRSIILYGLFLGMLLYHLPGAGQMPTAAITGREDVTCLGDSVAADLIITGKGPWTLVINDSQGEYKTLEKIPSPYVIWLKPETDNNYFIASVTDRLGEEGLTFGNVEITVLPSSPVDIVMDQTIYLKSQAGVSLVSSPPGATFFGNGVIGNIFYPGVATPVGSPHELSCTYTNLYGCESKDFVDVQVIHGESDVILVAGADTITSVCDDNMSYEIRGTNKDKQKGLFSIREVGSPVYLSGYIVDEDSSDNMASFNPSGLIGTYELVYTYEYDVLTITSTQRINVNDLESLTISGFPEIVCTGDEPYLLTPGNIEDDPDAVYTISGTGITGNQPDGYYFNPGMESVPLGPGTIQMDYTTSNGCYEMVEKHIDTKFSPDVSFSFTPSCLPPDGGTVSFTNTTTGKYSVEDGGSWLWDFGDPESGSLNTSVDENASHNYSAPGRLEIILTATTVDGCVASSPQDTVLPDQPVADMTWFHDCYLKGEDITFLDRSVSEFSQIDFLQWTFKTEDDLVLGVLESTSSDDTITFPFSSQSKYKVELEVRDLVGCSDKTSKELRLRPTYPITSQGYHQNFNGNTEYWDIGKDNVSSWILSEPDFSGFEPVSGDKAWFTDLPMDDPLYLERSWIESPCFDFRNADEPVINLDVLKSLRPGKDGAVLQYLAGTGEDWVTLGNIGEGTNWYNVEEIENRPGGSVYGWGQNQLFQNDT